MVLWRRGRDGKRCPKGTIPDCNNRWRRGAETLSQQGPTPAIRRGKGALAESSRRLQGLLRVAQDVNSSLELPVVLDRILSCAREILGAESGSIMLLEPEKGSLRVVAARGPREREIVGRSQSLEEGVAGWVTLRGEPLLLHGRVQEPSVFQICERADIRDALCAPLRVEGQVLGAISLNNRILPGHPFDEEDLELLVALANQAAVAIRNAESYAEMRRQRETVERLLSELARAQVEERKRIALQLHDGPAQTMYAAFRNLETARVLARDAGPELGDAFQELERTIRQSIDETRAVMLDLRPPVMDWGLESALRQYAQQFEKRTGIRTEVARRGAARRLPEPMESCLYRIAQEALTNVWKHAEARTASVVLEVGRRRCSLEIADDGKGFEPEAVSAEEKEHLGLMSLRDRAQLVGGQLLVSCRPGSGTRVRVSAPLTD